MTISNQRREAAYDALRAAGFTSPETRELLAGPKGLRDELAASALTGIFARQSVVLGTPEMAGYAYELADAMMLERAT